MKKIVTLLLIVIAFSACESSSTNDYIVGKWKVKSYTINGTTSEVLDECDANSSFVFSSNGRFQSVGRQANQDGENCMFSWANNWKKENNYYFVCESYPDLAEPSIHAKLTKINNDSILVEYISNQDINLKKILVRQ